MYNTESIYTHEMYTHLVLKLDDIINSESVKIHLILKCFTIVNNFTGIFFLFDMLLNFSVIQIT